MRDPRPCGFSTARSARPSGARGSPSFCRRRFRLRRGRVNPRPSAQSAGFPSRTCRGSVSVRARLQFILRGEGSRHAARIVQSPSTQRAVIPPALRHEGSCHAARPACRRQGSAFRFGALAQVSTRAEAHLVNGSRQSMASVHPEARRPVPNNSGASGVLTPEAGMMFGYGIHETVVGQFEFS